MEMIAHYRSTFIVERKDRSLQITDVYVPTKLRVKKKKIRSEYEKKMGRSLERRKMVPRPEKRGKTTKSKCQPRD